MPIDLGMRIVHFGATGNLGVHVLPRLLQTDHEVTCVVRSEPRFRDAFDSPSCSVIEGCIGCFRRR